jgi:hypothetical protein
MKEVKDMNLAECRKGLRAITKYNHPIADRIDTLLFEQSQRHDAWVDACENRINSLEAQHRWIPVSERMPTEADADKYGEVMWLHSKIGAVITKWGVYRNSVYVTHWKRITPPEGV